MTNITDYVLDLETMGNRPTSAIISIGACAFNRHAEQFESLDSFYTNVSLHDSLKHGLTVDASTIMWWMEQDAQARFSLMQQPLMKLHEALEEFRSWVTGLGWQIPCWSHATFDAPILNYAYQTLGLELPTYYRKHRDIRTLEDLNGFYELKRQGTHHNALDDAVFQAEIVWGLLNKKGVRK